jgi:hypothetical protein
MNKFKVGDTVSWKTVGVSGEFRVIDVLTWEPKSLLLTDIEAGSGKCFIALMTDCHLVNRDENFTPKQFVREIKEVAKQLIYSECSEDI